MGFTVHEKPTWWGCSGHADFLCCQRTDSVRGQRVNLTGGKLPACSDSPLCLYEVGINVLIAVKSQHRYLGGKPEKDYWNLSHIPSRAGPSGSPRSLHPCCPGAPHSDLLHGCSHAWCMVAAGTRPDPRPPSFSPDSDMDARNPFLYNYRNVAIRVDSKCLFYLPLSDDRGACRSGQWWSRWGPARLGQALRSHFPASRPLDLGTCLN